MVALLYCVPFGTDIANLLECLFGYIDLIATKMLTPGHNVTISDGKDKIFCLDGLPVMVSGSIYGAFGANRRRAVVAILQVSSIPHALFRAFNARGRKGNDFSNASD